MMYNERRYDDTHTKNGQKENAEMAELFNEKMKPKEYKDEAAYYSMVLDQWKTAISIRNELGERRSKNNTFYISLLSFFITVAGFVGVIKETVHWEMILLISIFCIVLCISWINSINSYQRLNSVKFNVINQIEKKLPVNVLAYEWSILNQGPQDQNAGKNEDRKDKKNKKEYKHIPQNEKNVCKIFIVFFSIVALISIMMLVSDSNILKSMLKL